MKNIYKVSAIGAASLVLFLVAFFMLQHNGIYQHTLGKISSNYERTGGWKDYTISQVKKSYNVINNENTLAWDGGIYYDISKYAYVKDIGGYPEVKAAFFPLFPMIWRATGLSPVMICFFNYLVFAVSLYLLIRLLTGNQAIQVPAFAFSLLMPSVVIYYLPYSEAVFMLSFTLALAGMLKKRYSLYFIGMMLTAMTRPATGLLLIAMIGVEILALIRHRNFRFFVVQSARKFIPYLFGVFLVFLLYYINTGNWFELFRAQAYWDNTFGIPTKISDWSVEGFGLNIFTTCFLVIPATVYLLRQLLRAFTKASHISTPIYLRVIPHLRIIILCR